MRNDRELLRKIIKKFVIFTERALDKPALFIYNIHDYSNNALTFKEE